MNYGELKTAIIEDTHRSDLTSLVPRFVRQCEGLLRRDLRGYLVSTTISDGFRVSGGVYNLPARTLEIRSIHLQGREGDALARVSPGQIRRLDSTADVLQYAQYGDGTVEFRGVPGATDVFDVLYYGVPAPFSADSDENELLTDHESLYMAGSKFFLYLHTQDRELANDELDIFNGILDKLNEQTARRIGGGAIGPTYNFAGGSSY